jgi:hypothetical protein
MFGRLRALIAAAALLAPSATLAQVQVNQTFIPQGPSPKFGPIDVVQSGDAPPNGTVAGAVQTILLDPALGPQTLFIGGVNGGIWRTTNGGASWTPLTDKQASLSIASMALDPSDSTGKTLIAGVGITSNGAWNNFNVGGATGRGGARTGLLYSTDGGNSWSAMGGPYLTGQSVIGVAAAGSTILAATFEEQAPRQTVVSSGSASYGRYLSNNGGKSFSLIQPGSGLPAGPVTALVADPQNPGNCGTQQSCTFYASVTSASTPSATGVYVTHNAGQSWSPVFTSATAVSGGTNVITGAATFQLVPKLAAGPNGSVAIAIAQLQPSPSSFDCVQPNCNGQQLTGLYLSQNGGQSWSALAVPPTNKGVMQAAVNLAVAIDPTDTKTVYVTGDGINGNPFTVPAFRVKGPTFTSLTLDRTSNGSTAHSDSRGLVVDSSGNLWMTSDGGVYMRSNPQSDNGAWTGLNTSTLQLQETYGVAYDTLSKRAAAAMQDTGVAIQASRASALWNALSGADGTSVSINGNFTANTSALYLTTDSLGSAGRIIYDATGKRISPDTGPTFSPATPINCTYNPLSGPYAGCAAFVPDTTNPGSFTNNSPFLAPMVLNRANPTQIAIAPGFQNFNGVNGNFVYVAQDTTPASAASVTLQTTSVGKVDAGATVTALAYGIPASNNQGASANPNALLAGVQNGRGELWFSSNVGASPLVRLRAYTQAGGLSPTSMVFDPTSPSAQSSPGQIRFYVADSVNLWGTNNQGAQINSLTDNLPAGFIRPTAVEFISNNGVNALLVGGLLTPLTCDSSPNGCLVSSTQSPITVVDSDGSGNLSGWRAFGQGLPNTLVAQLVYYPSVDVLVVGAVGRGVWTLYDVTSYFPQATVLQFGLANNDSLPDASFLTDGTNLNGTTFSRPLNKYGTGTLTIAGNATYTDGTTIYGGRSSRAARHRQDCADCSEHL